MDRKLRTCVHPDGRFIFGIHRPDYHVINTRINTRIMGLGVTDQGEKVKNQVNFPQGDLEITGAQPIYEIPNAFPFWGTTYILGDVAMKRAESKEVLSLSPSGKTSFSEWEDLRGLSPGDIPRPVALAIAQTCKSSELLEMLLPLAAVFQRDDSGQIIGLRYERASNGALRPKILDHDLYETLGNNPALPDHLKQVMLLRPGVQGTSPIVGEYVKKDKCHIWEYLRANSYIPWGHFAANMAEDSIRYSVDELDLDDITGLRHLYYQRIYVSLCHELGIGLSEAGLLSQDELEELRCRLNEKIAGSAPGELRFSATLWGWNYGYDFSPSGFRLHASHQQIHQQFALIPEAVQDAASGGSPMPSYAVGDLVSSFVEDFDGFYKRPFFKTYIKALLENMRTDGRKDLEATLFVYRDENVMLFVPKAQRFHGELNIITLKGVGNILEADTSMRQSLDKAIFVGVKVLSAMGARMITSFELSKRFHSPLDQRLMYCLIPKHPQSPGAFSEQQSRWITAHFSEDYARALRGKLEGLSLF